MRTSIGLCLTLLCLASGGAIAAELKLRPPPKPFAEYPAPPQPDYARAESWAALPGAPGMANEVPPGAIGGVATDPKADVFFIHPTTFLTNTAWNAEFDQGDFTKRQLEEGVLRHQVSAFNACCRIFVPRYRQATLSAFVNPGENANKAFELAYSDVLRAFDHYVTQDNRDRPFIIASHSQGSLHATRLLQERIANDPKLRSRLIVAYVVGAAMPDQPAFTTLPVCENPKATGCLVDWNSASGVTVLSLGRRMMVTYGQGRYQLVGNEKWLCVNPLSWDRQTTVPISRNPGSLPIADEGKPLPPLAKGVTGAKCDRGRLVVRIPYAKRKGFRDAMTLFGSYHNQDYNLFYASLRQNVMDRIEAFLKRPSEASR